MHARFGLFIAVNLVVGLTKFADVGQIRGTEGIRDCLDVKSSQMVWS